MPGPVSFAHPRCADTGCPVHAQCARFIDITGPAPREHSATPVHPSLFPFSKHLPFDEPCPWLVEVDAP